MSQNDRPSLHLHRPTNEKFELPWNQCKNLGAVKYVPIGSFFDKSIQKYTVLVFFIKETNATCTSSMVFFPGVLTVFTGEEPLDKLATDELHVVALLLTTFLVCMTCSIVICNGTFLVFLTTLVVVDLGFRRAV